MPKQKAFVVATAVFALVGCATFKAKDVAPPVPYDFVFINRMAEFSQAVYKDDVSIRAALASFDDVYIHVIPATNNKYFLATKNSTRLQVISIRGTENLQNIVTDADFTQQAVPSLEVSLHRGFAKAADLVYQDVRPKLKAGYKVHLTGHSLGGAEAVIVGMILQAAGTPAEHIVTFGQPRVTNQDGADKFKALPLTRVVSDTDVVPTLPPEPFRLIAPELVLFAGPYYSLVQERPFDPERMKAAWQALQNRQAPGQIEDHYMARYMERLLPKLTEPRLISYNDREKLGL